MKFQKHLALVLVAVLSAPCYAFPSVPEDFLNPPATAKSQVWWHWMADNVTREGDRAVVPVLDALQDAGEDVASRRPADAE